MTQSGLIETISALAAPLAASLGLSLWGVEAAFSGQGVIRIFAEGEHGITIDQCAELSRLLGLALDVEDCIPDAYVLEISSPGLERVFFTPAQLCRAKGRQIEVTLRQPHPSVPGRKKFYGLLAGTPCAPEDPSDTSVLAPHACAPAAASTSEDKALAQAGSFRPAEQELGLLPAYAAEVPTEGEFRLSARDVARPGEKDPVIAFTFAEVRKAKLIHFEPEKPLPGKSSGKPSGKAGNKTTGKRPDSQSKESANATDKTSGAAHK